MAQIGTIKLETQNNGTVSLPVFDTADAGSGVYDMVRVQTGSGTGFIPFVAPSDASFPYLRIQTQNQGILAAHNEASLQQVFIDDNFSTFDSGTWDLYDQATHTGSDIKFVSSSNSSVQGNLNTTINHNGQIRATWDFRNQNGSGSGFAGCDLWSDDVRERALGTDNKDNYISCEHNPDSNELTISVEYNNSGTTIASNAFTIDNDTFHLELEVNPSTDSVWARIEDSGGASTTVSGSHADVSNVAGLNNNFNWGGGHFSVSSDKFVDNIYVDDSPQNV